MRTYEVVDFAVGAVDYEWGLNLCGREFDELAAAVERKVSAGYMLCADLVLDTLMKLRELK